MRGSTAGLTDGLQGSSKLHYIFLTILDHCIAALIISPLVVSYWRGTWSLMDYFVYPDKPDISGIISLFLGLIGILLFTLTQKCHSIFLNPDKHRLLYYLVSRLYTACFSFVCVNSWRGVWQSLDTYTPTDPGSIALVTGTSLVLLVGLRSLRNISAPPFAIITDRYEGYFDVPTHFKSSTDNFWLFLLDCMFSVCIIGTLVVFVWRGFWCLLDHFLYPEDPTMSAWASLGVGYCVVALTFLLQPLMKYLAKELSGIARLAVVDTYLFFSFFGTVNLWRGVWNLLNVYLFPDNRPLSYALSHAIPFLILVMINSSNSILVRGVYIDCEEAGSQCVDFPCYYLRLFFQAQRKKKILKEAAKKSSERKEEEEGLVPVGRKATIISANADWKKTQNDSSPETNQLLADIP